MGLGDTAPPGVELLEVDEVISLGPTPDVLALARYGAHRYAGRLRPLLAAASPPRRVATLPPKIAMPDAMPVAPSEVGAAVLTALRRRCALVRVPPASSRLEIVETVLDDRARSGSVLVLVPEVDDVEVLNRLLARHGWPTAPQPGAWAEARAGGRVVVGARAAVFAPAPDLAAIVVLDAHAESYDEQRAPTYSAVHLAVRRAEAAGVPCVLASPCPSLEVRAEVGGEEVLLAGATERAGWPLVDVLDRRDDDPRSGLYAPSLATLVRAALENDLSRPVVCVLNRSGRARLLACGSCGGLARCLTCGAALVERAAAGKGRAGSLECPRGHGATERLCPSCGSHTLRLLRVGVGRAAEELAALTGVVVTEMSGPRRPSTDASDGGRLLVGTEAVLHRVRSASLVAFLDLDQELLAPRLRAGEQALALLARAARMLGGRAGATARPSGTGRLVLQTRLPDHEVVRAAIAGDPGLVLAVELPRRRALGLPPFSSLAVVAGDDADGFIARLRTGGGPGLDIAALEDGRFLVRAPDGARLADALATAGAPAPGVRIEVGAVER